MEIQNVELSGKHNYRMYKDVMRTYAMDFFKRYTVSKDLLFIIFISFALHHFPSSLL